MGSCAAPSAKGDDKFITTDYLQQCPCDTGERDRDGKQSGVVIPDKHAVWAAREAIARVKGGIV
ncbi:hypothetical protein LPQ26_28155, partial [Klebsiella pneumoniae]|nr:hypothetical protein [Klebsiella pneumoniae]